MRIVHIITRLIRGGADENTVLTCNGQAAQGHDIHLIVGADYHEAMTGALDHRVTLHILPELVREVAPTKDAAALFKIRSLLRRIRPDIAHTHESKAGVLGRFAARMAGVPLIAHGVHILPFLGVSRASAAMYLALEKAAARCTDVYIDVSKGMRDTCLQHGLGTSANHVIAPSGMDTGKYRNAAPVDDWQSLLPAGAPDHERPIFVLISGTLEVRKRVGDLIAALAENPPASSNWVLLVAGDGSERARLETLVADLGLSNHVRFLGHCSNLERLMALADLCVHAAGNEGLPRTVIQYVLAGKPVVSPALPGIEQVVEPGHSGTLVGVNDLAALAIETGRMIDDAALRAQYAAAARQMDLSAWDVSSMLKAIDQAYAIARKPRHRNGDVQAAGPAGAR